MIRSKVILAWGALLLGLTACDKTTDSPANKDAKPSSLTVSLSSSELVAGGAAVDLSVAALSDTGIVSILPSVKDASGKPAAGTILPVVTPMPKMGDKTFSSTGWKLSALSSASVGAYVLTLTLTEKSGVVSTKDVAFTVKAEGKVDTGVVVDTTVVTKNPFHSLGSLKVGAQGSTYGSFLVLSGQDAGTVFTSGSDLPTEKIDAIFGDDNGAAAFMSPTYAATGAFNLTSWPSKKVSAIADLGTSAPATVGAIEATLDARGFVSADVVKGHYYAVGTQDGAIMMLYVQGLTGTGRSAWANVEFFTVSEGVVVDPKTYPQVTLGAQSASAPSALDVDGMTAYTSGAKSEQEIASIDLLFYYMANELRLISPEFAGENAISMVSTWKTKNATFFYDNGTSPVADFSAAEHLITTKVFENEVKVVAGHYYVVDNGNGVVSVIRVDSVSGTGASATAKVSIIFTDDTMAG